MTHNLSALKHVDRILVVQGGRIAENGTFNELLHKQEDGICIEMT